LPVLIVQPRSLICLEQLDIRLLYDVRYDFSGYLRILARLTGEAVAVNGIGGVLRQERERQRLTVDDVALRTKISIRSLEAIEADEFDRLPGVVFARNFVRLYATDLGLDPEALVATLPRVDVDAAPMPNPPARPGRRDWDPRWTAAMASVLWLVTAGGAGIGAWYYFNHYGRHFVTTVSAAPAPKPAATQALRQKPPATHEGFDATRPVQVILTAHDVVWVQVSADGHTAFVGTLLPNDTRSIAADAQVRIVTGNAGGLDISLNGKTLDPIGPKGQTRTVSLTAEGPQLGPQNPPASSPL
jgi:cytoskeleton protein RodZ